MGSVEHGKAAHPLTRVPANWDITREVARLEGSRNGKWTREAGPFEGAQEGLERSEAAEAALPRSGASSPRACISFTMSQPPTSSPFT
jgi:hypothetical protein